MVPIPTILTGLISGRIPSTSVRIQVRFTSTYHTMTGPHTITLLLSPCIRIQPMYKTIDALLSAVVQQLEAGLHFLGIAAWLHVRRRNAAAFLLRGGRSLSTHPPPFD